MSVAETDIVPFPPLASITHGELLETSLSASTTTGTHGLHRFPAKFIPQVPRWAMNEFAGANSTVLDPFMGSGTTLVEGATRVGRVIGTDIDPLAVLISRAKTAAVSGHRIEELAGAVVSVASSRVSPVHELPMSGVINPLHWFSQQAMDELGAILEAIDVVQATPDEKDVLLTVFSSILRRVSRADDQSQKTYVSGTLAKVPPPAMTTFIRASHNAARAFDGGAQFRRANQVSAILGSALDIPLADGEVDLIVTSPPYLDSVDYMYNLMLEYFWLGPRLGVPDRSTFNRMRREGVGGSRDAQVVGGEVLDIAKDVPIADYRRPALRAYLALMQTHFSEASRVLAAEGRYVFVLGNSLSGGVRLPVADWMIRIAATQGLAVEKAFAYRIRRHYMKFPRKGRGGIILADWVITLRHSDVATAEPLPTLDVAMGADDVAH
ncbi:MAG: DNA methyltransferase [Rhodoglobus sp.]